MEYIKDRKFVCNILLPIILTLGTTHGSPLSDAVCGSPNNRRVIGNVTEDIEIGSSVAQLTVTGNSSQITLFMESNEYGFLLNSASRTVTTGKRLEIQWPESVNQITVTLTVRCSPFLSTLSKEVVLLFYVTIWDINDNPPEFVNAPYFVNISEWTLPGTTVISTIVAIDPDPSDIGYLVYSVDQESQFSSKFKFLVSSVGELVLQQLLKYDNVEIVKLTIFVKDNSNNHTVLGRVQPQYTSNTTVIINILRERYNPAFIATTFSGFISRNTAPESLVNVTPSIAVNTNAENMIRAVNYSIIYDPLNGDVKYFRIDNTTGQLTTFQPFTATTPCLLAFQIKVYERSRPWYFDISLVKLVITDDEETQRPCLSLQQLYYYTTVADNIAIGSLVAHIQLQQLSCLTDNHEFSFIDQTTYKYFAIDTYSGEIRTVATLLHTTVSRYVIAVKVTDGILTNFSTVFLGVKRSQHDVYFSKKVFIFNVTSAVGIIGRIDVKNNAYETLIYSLLISPQVKPPELFTIDDEGWLSAMYTLEKDIYTMAIVVHDENIMDTALIEVHVQDFAVSTSAEHNREALVAIGFVCGVLTLLSIVLIASLIVTKHRVTGEIFQRRNVGTPVDSDRSNSSPTSVTREQQGKDKEPDTTAGKTAVSSIFSTTTSANSIPSQTASSYDIDNHARKSEASLTHLPHELPQRLDQFSSKSCSTVSQPTVAEKCRYEEDNVTNDLDPSVIGSTVTLMEQMPTPGCDESLQGINNISSPGSLMSFGTQQRSEDAPGITVYY